MNKNKNEYIIRHYKKLKAINLLGGKCQECGEDRPWLLIFHHKDPEEKEFNICDILGLSWNNIEKEVLKCDLLCYNCHREIHNQNKETVHTKSKQVFLEIKNSSGCEICGYNKCLGTLEFHHEKNKNFNVGLVQIREKSSNEIKNKITEEINKCKVLCANCHADLHFDKEKFEKYKEEIYNFIYRPLKSSLDENKVMNLYNKGMMQKDIAKKLERNVSVICRIIQRNKRKC